MIVLDYQDRRPLYEQVEEKFRNLILKGVLEPGSRMPSVRQLAMELSINPNTIQRAYRELEAAGYLISVPGKGSFAAESSPLQAQKKQELLAQICSLAREAIVLGVTRDELLAQLDAKEEEA